MDTGAVWRAVDTARAALADDLESLPPTGWSAPSRCPGWQVRHLAAHVISSPGTSPAQLAAAMWRARGDFDRCVRDEGLRLGSRPTVDIVADYRRLAGSRRTPPGVGPGTALLDVLVHTDDILSAVGRSRPMPPEAAAYCAGQVWRRSFPFRARRRLAGVRLAATDADFRTESAGPLVTGPAEAMLLVLTGRPDGLRSLSGPGLDELSRRLAGT